MKILFISHCLPYPPNRGDKIRAFHEIRLLSRQHEIHLLCLAKEAAEIGTEGPLEEYCESIQVFPLDPLRARVRCLTSLIRGRPFSLGYFAEPDLVRAARRFAETESVEVVLAYTSVMAPLAELFGKSKKVCDLVDVDSAKWKEYAHRDRSPKRHLYELEGRRLEAYERQICRDFDQVVVTTDRELSILDGAGLSSRPLAIANGVSVRSLNAAAESKTKEPSLVFVGQMDYLPNIDAVVYFAEQVFPELKRGYPDVTFSIVGRSPSRAVQRLESIPGIVVTGEVEEIEPYLSRSWIFVAPLRIARGIQNKVLEAMAVGLAVVSTPQVAESLYSHGIVDGQHLMVADDPTSYCRSISLLVQDDDLRRRLGAAGREAMESGFSWRHSIELLENAIVTTRTAVRGGALTVDRQRVAPPPPMECR